VGGSIRGAGQDERARRKTNGEAGDAWTGADSKKVKRNLKANPLEGKKNAWAPKKSGGGRPGLELGKDQKKKFTQKTGS